MKPYFLPPFALALVGMVLAIIAYAAPLGNTGVDGSLGALLALVGAVATAIGTALLALSVVRGALAGAILALSLLAAVLTAVAAWFLLQVVFALVMAASAVGLVIAPLTSRRRSRP